MSFTAAAGPVVLLAAAAPASGTNGLFDINVQNSASAAVFDQIQTVSPAGGFISQPITLGTSGNYNVTLTDLKTPAAVLHVGAGRLERGQCARQDLRRRNLPDHRLAGQLPAHRRRDPGLAAAIRAVRPRRSSMRRPPSRLSASPASVTAGGAATLTWTTTSATACTGSGGTFTGSQATGSGSLAVSVAATTTYTLSCTGPGGSASKSVTVMATAVQSSSGGGATGLGTLAGLALLAFVRVRRAMQPGSAARRPCA